MAGDGASSNASISRKRVEADTTSPSSLKRARDGSAVAKWSMADPTKSTTEDAEKSKKKADELPETSVKNPFIRRLWSEEDEIVILKGMVDYSAKKKIVPAANCEAFLHFIKKNLHVVVTKTQLQDKIRKLKRKYENNRNREKEDGRERIFSKRHDQKSYELSKRIWGRENVEADEPDFMAVKEKLILESGSERVMMMVGAELFEDSKGNEGKQWNERALVLEEMEAYRRCLEVNRRCLEVNRRCLEVNQRYLDVKLAQTSLVIERLKSVRSEDRKYMTRLRKRQG